MKIAIEAQRIFRPNKHGMDFVVLETIRELQKLDRENEYFILVSPGTDRCLQDTDNFHIVEVKVPSYPLWEQIGLPLAIRKIKPDLLHCTSNTAPFWCNVPLVLTLHDIIFLEKRDGSNKSFYQNLGWYYRRLVVPRILPKCRKVITVSEFEKDNICSKTKLRADKVIAIHNGYSRHFRMMENYRDVVDQYVPKGTEYFFFLGNTDPKKNTKRVLKAYAQYVEQSKAPVSLLIADLKEEVVDTYLKDLNIEKIRGHLIIPGYIRNTDLPAIYNGATAFIYTSLRESFGIPLLEGMACGTPVISSNISAIPEIAGTGAILVDPYNENAITEQLIKIENDKAYRAAAIDYGKQRVSMFSWEHTAENVLRLYKSILNA